MRLENCEKKLNFVTKEYSYMPIGIDNFIFFNFFTLIWRTNYLPCDIAIDKFNRYCPEE